ncbi:Oxysterol-binding protein- protein 9 [Cichlidogyrus casuarinus]|uniref:Oxysterol-binding protein n=1 Tax=Cichlidogyrus casuarinus TaxID=1844966 RepID=A0ABD2Q2K6_9PLAT
MVLEGKHLLETRSVNGNFDEASTTGHVSVPVTSYSSDEEDFAWSDEENATASGGEEIFFDTVENLPLYVSLTHLAPERLCGGSHTIRASTSISSLIFPSSHHGHASQSNSYDIDPLYDEAEDDLGNVSAHGSVIMHLVSQVRIGMDLTKITLPTFILERRSTLEMYADFLAHADLWASITEHDHERDRFVCALRWYLSAFHAGRRSPVAKKPYNPILGEIFRCYWDLEKSSVRAPDDKNSRRPVPWAPDNAVCFIAEQVSHHPPISAFYAEHKSRGIICQGSLWTKSKFLGLSIGVEMVGSATLSVLDLEEDYTVTFPGAYGRNILSVPWVELGGKCSVSCEKTGYYANVEFKTKPFYGGKKDQIRVEAFGPDWEGGKKPFLVVEGEWNSVMMANWADGRSEVFFDTRKSAVCAKRVRPRFEQENFESRKLWQDVTMHLKRGTIEQATEAKSILEQRQREEAKHRRENNLDWKPRFFFSEDNTWLYRWPMTREEHQKKTTSSTPEIN